MPKIIACNGREMVLRIQEYFKKEREHKGPLIPYHKVNERVSVATGISKGVVARILNEATVNEVIEDETTPTLETSPNTTNPEENSERKGKSKQTLLKRDVVNMVLKVRNFFQLEKEEKGPIISFDQVNNRVAVSMGISIRTITRIAREGKLAKETNSPIIAPTGKATKIRKDKIMINIDFLREKIHELILKNENPSVRKIHQILREETGLKGSREIVRKYIKEIYNEEGTILKPPNAKSILKNKAKQHKKSSVKNKDIFENIIYQHNVITTNTNTEKIIKIPNSRTSKSEIENYLISHNIEYCDSYTKTQLLEIVKCYNSESMYDLDRFSIEHGQERSRSPIEIYHCVIPNKLF